MSIKSFSEILTESCGKKNVVLQCTVLLFWNYLIFFGFHKENNDILAYIFINMWFSKFDVIAAVLTALWITHNTFHCVRHRVTNIRTTQQLKRANQGLNVPNFPSSKYTPSRRQWIKSWPKYFTFNTMHIHPAFHGNVRYSQCNIIHQSAGIIPTR